MGRQQHQEERPDDERQDEVGGDLAESFFGHLGDCDRRAAIGRRPDRARSGATADVRLGPGGAARRSRDATGSAGGASAGGVARTALSKPMVRCDESQNGFVAEAPQRHRVTALPASDLEGDCLRRRGA